MCNGLKSSIQGFKKSRVSFCQPLGQHMLANALIIHIAEVGNNDRETGFPRVQIKLVLQNQG